jgi:Flp pilus assembly protein TadD
LQVDYDKELFEEALRHLDFAIQRAPQRQDLRVFQCFLLTDSGSIERARSAIANALAALPKAGAVASLMASYGAERAKRDDPAGGARLLAPVVAAYPKDASVLVDYGNVLTRLGKKDEAFAAFDRATAIAPQETRYVRTKAVSAMLLRDFRRAHNAFDAAFTLGQGAADRLASLAASYGIEPKASEGPARELGAGGPSADPSVTDLGNQFAAAAKSGPSSRDALTLARTLIAAQQYVLAIPVLDRAIKAAPANSEAKTMLKTVYGELGCPSLAPR